MKSWARVKNNRMVTSPSLAARILGHPDGSVIGIPLSCSNRGPVIKRTMIALQTTERNRKAVVRISTALCEANGSRLSTGTSTTDRNSIPPIQATAARRWSHITSRVIDSQRRPVWSPLIGTDEVPAKPQYRQTVSELGDAGQAIPADQRDGPPVETDEALLAESAEQADGGFHGNSRHIRQFFAL